MRDEALDRIRDATANDHTLVALGQAIVKGWPDEKSKIAPILLPYYNYRDELSVENGIIVRSERIVIPSSLRKLMKEKVHTGHLGINACLRRARELLYWPGMSAEIRQYIETCGTCANFSDRQQHEPKVITEVSPRPWQKVASDLFAWGGGAKTNCYVLTTIVISLKLTLSTIQHHVQSLPN